MLILARYVEVEEKIGKTASLYNVWMSTGNKAMCVQSSKERGEKVQKKKKKKKKTACVFFPFPLALMVYEILVFHYI